MSQNTYSTNQLKRRDHKRAALKTHAFVQEVQRSLEQNHLI